MGGIMCLSPAAQRGVLFGFALLLFAGDECVHQSGRMGTTNFDATSFILFVLLSPPSDELGGTARRTGLISREGRISSM